MFLEASLGHLCELLFLYERSSFLDVDEFSHEHVVILHNFECGIEGVWMNKCIMLLLWIRCGRRIRVVSLCRGRNGVS